MDETELIGRMTRQEALLEGVQKSVDVLAAAVTGLTLALETQGVHTEKHISHEKNITSLWDKYDEITKTLDGLPGRILKGASVILSILLGLIVVVASLKG